MASSACCHIRRIIAAKSPRPVVTRGAIISRAFMLLCLDSRDLTSLRRSGADGMTFGAIHSLSGAVLAMAEDGAKDISTSRSPSVRSYLVTDVARTDLALGSVTGVARCV